MKTLNLFKTAFAVLGLTILSTACAKADMRVQPSDLPERVTQFVAANFGEFEIVSATADTDEAVTEYELTLSNGIKIDIDANGQWDEVSCRQPESLIMFLPSRISSYILANYPGTKVLKVDKDNSGFDVELDNRVELEFYANGAFKKVD